MNRPLRNVPSTRLAGQQSAPSGATRRLHGGQTEAYQKIKINPKKQKGKKEKRKKKKGFGRKNK
jgi:hypothetical protein